MSRSLAIAAVCATAVAVLSPPATADTLDATAWERRPSTNASPDARVSFYVGLARPEDRAKAALRRTADPASRSYRRFPGRESIARRYGAQRPAIRALRRSASSDGLRVSVDATGVFATVSGTAGRMSQWVGAPIKVRKRSLDGIAVTQYTTRGRPPRALRGVVEEFVPLDVHSRVLPQDVTAQRRPERSYAGINRGTPDSCLADISAELNRYTYSFNQLRTAYGLDNLPTSRRVGRASRVTIMSLGDGFSEAALAVSAECFGVPRARFERVPVPGLIGDLPEGGEGDLDVQVVQAVLPRGSTVHVVETSGFDLRLFLAWAVAYGQERLPHAITSSYGLCEPDLRKIGPDVTSLTDSVLLRLGLAGTSLFAAAGDRGSSDCINNETGTGPVKAAVDYPGSSTYVTSVGGTRIALDRANRRVREYVWNSSDSLPPIGPDEVAGGGGRSVLFDRPWWQPADMTRATVRTVPDLSAHAANGPGYPVAMTGADGELDIQLVGGTSAATPFTAATVGILAAGERLAGRPPYGLIQPALYRMARQRPATFYDVRIGDNDLHDQGCCSARVGYDLASGIGAPNFAPWRTALPRPAAVAPGRN